MAGCDGWLTIVNFASFSHIFFRSGWDLGDGWYPVVTEHSHCFDDNMTIFWRYSIILSKSSRNWMIFFGTCLKSSKTIGWNWQFPRLCSLLSDDQTRVGEFFRRAYDWHVEMFHQLGLEGLDTFCHKLVTESIEIGSWILWSFTLVQVRLKRFSSARLTVSFFQSRLILLRRSAPPTTQRILGSCWQR